LQPIWILNDLYVLTDYRRLGIGRALIQQAVNLARARGDKGLTLQTMPENLPAQALYKSMGFVEDTKSMYFVNWFSENE
jgi:ribosomal protein S18 acetylase RimI-like enzyme